MTALLSGVRVVDLSRVLAGPFAGHVLAEMGAEVVKVELPRGDPAREIGPHRGDRSLYFSSVNSGKRGVVVDPDDPADRDLLDRLFASADIVLENFRREAAEGLGLTPERVLEDHPHVVLVTVSGYARDSDRADRGAYDLTVQAEAGVMSVTGEPGRPPVRAGVPVSDLSAGLWAALAAVGGLESRRRTGRGLHLEVPLIDATLPLLSYMATAALDTGEDPPRVGSGHHSVVPYGAFPAADGWVVIAGLADKLWEPLCRALGLDRLAERDDLQAGGARVEARDEIDAAIAEATRQHATADLLRLLEEAGVPASPVLGLRDALATDYVTGRGLVEHVATPEGGYGIVHGPLCDPRRRSASAPSLGQHTEEIRRGMGGAPPGDG